MISQHDAISGPTLSKSRATAMPIGQTVATQGGTRAWQQLPMLQLALLLLVIAAILVLRRPDALLLPQLWAEDGITLFKDAAEHGLGSLAMPVPAGYLFVGMRLIALVSSAIPAAAAPLLYNLSALAITLLVAWRLTSARLELPYRPLLALAVVLVPHTGEVFLNVTNVQWILSLLLLTLPFMTPARTRNAWLADVATLVLCGLTGPFVFFVLPIYAMRLAQRWRSEERGYYATMTGLAILVAIVQAVAIVGAPPQVVEVAAASGNRAVDAAIVVVVKSLSVTFLGGTLPYDLPRSVLMGITALVGGVFVLLLMRRRASTRMIAIVAFVAFGAMVTAGALLKYRANPADLLPFDHGDRYFYVMRVMVAWTLIVLLADEGWRRRAALVLLVAIPLASLARFQWPAPQDYHWERVAPAIDAGEPVRVTTPPGWTFELNAGTTGGDRTRE